MSVLIPKFISCISCGVFVVLLCSFCITDSSLTQNTETSQRRVTTLNGNGGTKHQKNSNGNDENVDTKREKRQREVFPTFSPRMKYQPFILPENYSNLLIPTHAIAYQNTMDSAELMFDTNAVMYAVTVAIRIRNVNEVNELDQEITFTADLTLQWTDYVIRAGTLRNFGLEDDDVIHDYDELFRTLDPSLLDQIWKPDIFIENLIKVQTPELLGSAGSVRFNQVSGKIIYSSRLRIKMECEMDFHHYPADTQTCVVALRSTNYEDHEMSLFWESADGGVFLEDCEEPNFYLQLAGVNNYGKKVASTNYISRSFNILEFKILARRKMSYHIVQTFLPSVFFIIITWLTFLVPSRMIEARIGIAMTTLLTLTAMFASVRESTPIVSYVRAIDIWMLVCIFFVFLTLLEFAVTLWLRSSKEEEEGSEELKMKNVPNPIDDLNLNSSKLEDGDGTKVELRPSSPQSERRKRINRIKVKIGDFLENHAFLIFSVLFCIFNAIYWPWLFSSSDYFDWEVNHDINCPVPPASDGQNK